MTFKQLISRLKPANKNLEFMEVKELSEIVAFKEAKARQAIRELALSKKDYKVACNKYVEQCQKPKW